MSKNIVIVESPAKAKTIKKFLGNDFEVMSSYGHIADLPSKDMGIDIENNFSPTYIVNDDKKNIVKELKAKIKKAECVWLASDEDREGEAIAWHLYNTLKLDKINTKRIVFHEITKKAIQKAVENPREIDYNLVNAQQARRVLDRLVGYKISPVLWKKIKMGLSAGRVQSVAVRLIAEREEEINNFKEKSFFRVVGNFKTKLNENLKSLLSYKFKTEEELKDFLEKIKGENFTVSSIEKKPAKRTPSAPFTTSTLQQEASRKLGFSVNQTMRTAQYLYENGFITYMRTDSVSLSDEAKEQAKKEISTLYGQDYIETRDYKTKSKGAQEAHEAIRPTNLLNKDISVDDSSQKKLYDLIWKRTLASQMANAKLDRTILNLDNKKVKYQFISEGEVVVFDGFLKVYKEGTDDDDNEDIEGLLPKVEKGDEIPYNEIISTEKFTKHPPRYTEASLVKKMEELSIGRPSTYAPTISTIQKREYVLKEDREGKEREYKEFLLSQDAIKKDIRKEITGTEKKKLFPTDTGVVVNDFLIKTFDKVLDYNFTAKIEEEFDDISIGKREWTSVISDFYGQFHMKVEKAKEIEGKFVGERILGTDEKTGKPISVRIGRFGAMAQIGTKDDDEKPLFASLKKDQHISTITLEEVLELFKLPREIGEYKGEKVIGAVGRFGPYLKFGKLFVSVKDIDLLDITLEQSIKKIDEKIEAEKNKYILVFDKEEPLVEVLNGRFGPYIKIEKKNIKIPKDIDPKTLTKEKCLELRDSIPEKKKRVTIKKMNKKIFILILFPLYFFSQDKEFTIKCKVDNHILENVSVSYQNNRFFSDKNGKIKILLKKDTKYRFYISGYKPLVKEYNELLSTNTIFLDLDIFDLEQVVLTSFSDPKKMDKSIYNIKLVKSGYLEKLGANTLNDALRFQGNTQITQDGILGTQIRMQGMTGEHIKILIDGVPVVGRENGNIDLSQIDISNIEHIEIIEGPLSVIYGSNAIGGTINIITKKGDFNKKFKGNLISYWESVGQYNGKISLSKGFKNHNFNIDFGRNQFTGYDNDISDRSSLFNPKTQYFGNFNYSFKQENYDINLGYNHSIDNLTILGDEDLLKIKFTDQNFLTNRSILYLRSNININENNTLQNQISYSRYIRESKSVYTDLSKKKELVTPKYTTIFNNINARITLESKYEKLEFQNGIDYNFDNGKGRRILGQKDMNDIAYWGSITYKFSEELKFQPGMRAFYNDNFSTPLLYSLSTYWNDNSNYKFKLSTAKGFRSPSLKERFFHFVDSNHEIYGNENLTPENSYHISSQFSYKRILSERLGMGVTFDISTFYNNLDDAIELSFSNNNLGGFSYINIGNKQTYGGSIFISSKKHKKYNSKIGIDFLNTKYLLNGYSVDGNSYNFMAMISYTLPYIETDITLDYKYNGRLINITSDIVSRESSKGYVDAYHMMNMSFSKKFWKDKININIGAKNLFDIVNIQGQGTGGGGGHSGGSGGAIISWGRTYFIKMKIQIL